MTPLPAALLGASATLVTFAMVFAALASVERYRRFPFLGLGCGSTFAAVGVFAAFLFTC